MTLEEIARLRARASFNQRYTKQGGVDEFLRMAEAGTGADAIGQHFGFTYQTVHHYYYKFTGTKWGDRMQAQPANPA